MDEKIIRNILKDVSKGSLNINKAYSLLKNLPFEELKFAKIDHHREMRSGIPEVIFAEGKRDEDVIKLASSIYKKNKKLLITRASQDLFEKLNIKDAKYYPLSRIIAVSGAKELKGNVLIITAGTCDIPVAEEAGVTATFLGSRVRSIYDVGVAGLHRIFSIKEDLMLARVIIVVAGMEGALPSIIGGLVDKPLIAVPTSVGYGANLGGLTTLFAMLNSCVPGIAVMNINNGFGAGCLAHRINVMR